MSKYSNKELVELGKEVTELNETFQIVNELIAVQGQSIETLEDSIDNTLDNIEVSNNELVSSENLQTAANKKRVIITGVGLIAVSIPLCSSVGVGIGIPVVFVGYGCYKLMGIFTKLFKDKTYNTN
jgi:t-SNARE complex subunit (syntaxin)